MAIKVIKVMIAFSNLLFSKGVGRLLDDEKDLSVAYIDFFDGDIYNKIKTSKSDVVLVDFTTLYNSNFEKGGESKFILFDTCCGEENIISAILSKGISGVIPGNTPASLLKRAILSVAGGEVWFDKEIVKNLISGVNAVHEKKATNLSNREREIITLVSRGYKNKEIANNLFISEPTVKSHLYNIFRKLDIQNRPQLVAFAYKNLEGFTLPKAGSGNHA
jgi:DNA-binding NarL/FixJ family response regulator